MQACPSCHEENPDKFRLCGFCGTPLAAGSDASPIAASAAALAPVDSGVQPGLADLGTGALAPAVTPAVADTTPVVTLPAQEVRKTVTIVFSDLKGSTDLGERLDSEALREVMSRYFDAMQRELERHGGTVEKFIGDAVMAVFGLPVLHEDDALRAVRAAAAMRVALARINDDLETRYGVRLSNRTGVNTGEVVAGDPTAGQRLVTGDPVNTAARLEQAAPADDVLIGELTYQLVRDAVEVEPVEPLTLKGKAEPVPAYKLLTVRGTEGRVRRDDAPMVGRTAEMAVLSEALAVAIRRRQARQVTIVGDAGVGKSRLILEFTRHCGDEVGILRGRCLPYGEGITFWPFVEVTRAATGTRDGDPAETVRANLLGLVVERDVAARVASILGLTPAQFPLPELYWGAQRLLEVVAASRPLIVVFDDIHWAEHAFLGLIQHLLAKVTDAQLLIVSTTRHDLFEREPEWATEPGSERIILQPLSASESGEVVANLLGNADVPDSVRDRIVAASEGNPLYVEQMLSMLIESGALRREDGRWVRADHSTEIQVPPTIQALLSARLDQLGREERAVIEPASVIGVTFQEPAVEALAPDPLRASVATQLSALAGKQLVRPGGEDGADVPGQYRFHHILIRDAAYNGMLKRARATLHERFVAWADSVNGDRATEFEEILGYHLEQAYRYRAELGPLDERGTEIGRDGARRLASAARRAFARGDMHAAANQLRRAVDLLPEHDATRLGLMPELGEALMETGEFEQALAVLGSAVDEADDLFDDRLRAHAALRRLMVQYFAGGDPGLSQRIAREVEASIPVFEREGDHAGLTLAWRLMVGVHGAALRYGAGVEAAEHVMEHARLAGDLRLETRGASGYAVSALYGPLPVADAVRRCTEIVERVGHDRLTVGVLLCELAELESMQGDFDGARAHYRRGQEMLRELGSSLFAASTSTNTWRVEALAGDLEAACRELRRDHDALRAIGERYLLSTVAGLLGGVLLDLGRGDEAEAFADEARELADDDDTWSQQLWRSVRARVLSRRGRHDEAVGLAVEGLRLLDPVEAPVIKADALADFAEVLEAANRLPEAAGSLGEALTLYEAKGNVVSAARVRARLEAFPSPAGRG